MAAFQRAIELGADGIEFDVHSTSDGGLVVLHDELLHRTTNGSGAPIRHDLQYVRSLDAGSSFDPAYSGERVPLLEEVLTLPDLEFELELKSTDKDSVVRAVECVIGAGVMARTEFTSWNFPMLIWLKERWSNARLGLFSMPRWDWMDEDVYVRTVLSPLPYGTFDVVHAYASSITAGLADEIHSLDLAVHANDAVDEAAVQNALVVGADRLSANDVAMAKAVLRQH
jgi:glycerophosphoryl diester phosphodiesterase